jgi:hypothetical protein
MQQLCNPKAEVKQGPASKIGCCWNSSKQKIQYIILAMLTVLEMIIHYKKKVKHVQVPLETQLGKSIQLPADWLLH